MSLISKFIRGEEGLVTVEWVALTAGMVVAAIAIGFITMQTTAGQAQLVGGNVMNQADQTFGATGDEAVAKLKGGGTEE